MAENRHTARRLVSKYGETGFTVHSGKNEIMTDCDEFLRLTVDDGRVVGYPARLIMSIVYSKPGKEEPTTKYDRIHSIITGHVRLKLRGCDTDKVVVVDKLLFNLRRWFPECCTDTICNFLLTPVSLGGFGIPEIDEFGRSVAKKMSDFLLCLKPPPFLMIPRSLAVPGGNGSTILPGRVGFANDLKIN
jgi:hypothetical protein